MSELPLADVDPLRIREVLVNLVANALRYTPNGGAVAISARADGPRLRLEVRTTVVAFLRTSCRTSSTGSQRASTHRDRDLASRSPAIW